MKRELYPCASCVDKLRKELRRPVREDDTRDMPRFKRGCECHNCYRESLGLKPDTERGLQEFLWDGPRFDFDFAHDDY